MVDERTRELEREAAAGDPQSLRALIRSLAREGVFSQCERCGRFVGKQAEAYHRYEHEYEDLLNGQTSRVTRVIGRPPAPTDPTNLPIGVRVRREPLWHKLYLLPRNNPERATFFSRKNSTYQRHGSTNIPILGSSPSLPSGWHAWFEGISLVLDDDTSPEDVTALRFNGSVWIQWGAENPDTILNDLPSQVVYNPRYLPAPEVFTDPKHSPRDMVPMHDLRVSGRPLEIFALQAFNVQLNYPPLKRQVGVTCILHGLIGRPATHP